jgi:hypothetical protein
MARIPLAHELPDAAFQFFRCLRLGNSVGEDGGMDVCGRISSGTPDNDLVVPFIPFQNGSWASPKLFAALEGTDI